MFVLASRRIDGYHHILGDTHAPDFARRKHTKWTRRGFSFANPNGGTYAIWAFDSGGFGLPRFARAYLWRGRRTLRVYGNSDSAAGALAGEESLVGVDGNSTIDQVVDALKALPASQWDRSNGGRR